MAIYPLTPPSGDPKPDAISIQSHSVVSQHVSPFTRTSQVQVWAGQQRTLTAQWAGIVREDAEPWEAFFHELNGAEGTFLFPAVWGAEPRGTGELITSGVNTGKFAAVKGGGQTGNQLVTRHWKPSELVLKAGDYFEVRDNYLASPEDLDLNLPWIPGQIGTPGLPVVTKDNAAAPDGTTTAEKIAYFLSSPTQTSFVSQSNGDFRKSPLVSDLIGREFDFRAWIKSDGANSIDMRLTDSGGSTQINKALTTDWADSGVNRVMASTGSLAVEFRNRASQPAANIFVVGVTLDDNQTSTLYKVLKDATTDANGDVTLDIWPNVRREHGDYARIITSNPQGRWRLRGFPQFDIDDVLMRSFTMVADEVVD